MLTAFHVSQQTQDEQEVLEALPTMSPELEYPFFSALMPVAKPRDFDSTFKDFCQRRLEAEKIAPVDPKSWIEQALQDEKLQAEYRAILAIEKEFYENYYKNEKVKRGFVSYVDFIDLDQEAREVVLATLRENMAKIKENAHSLREQYHKLNPKDPDYDRKVSHYMNVLDFYGGVDLEVENTLQLHDARFFFRGASNEIQLKHLINETLKDNKAHPLLLKILDDWSKEFAEDVKAGVKKKLQDKGIVLEATKKRKMDKR